MKAKTPKRDGGAAPRVEPRTTTIGPMNEDVFWALIACFDWEHAGDDDAVIGPAVAALSRMSVEDVFAFDDLLAEKLYALDTREMCRGIYRGELDPDDGDAYVSADGFLYARCTIVANGRAFYEATLANPMAAPQGSEFEGLLYLAGAAYEEKVGDEYPHVTPVSWESFSNAEGWKTTAATTAGRFTGDGVPPGNRRPTLATRRGLGTFRAEHRPRGMLSEYRRASDAFMPCDRTRRSRWSAWPRAVGLAGNCPSLSWALTGYECRRAAALPRLRPPSGMPHEGSVEHAPSSGRGHPAW